MRGKQVREFRNGTFAVNPVGGKRFGISECVHLVKYFGVPYTGTWRRGPQVCHMKPGELPVGTVSRRCVTGRTTATIQAARMSASIWGMTTMASTGLRGARPPAC